MFKYKKKSKLLLSIFIVSIIDLLFGILSMVFEPFEWQLISTLASVLSFILVARLMIEYKEKTASNIIVLVIGAMDILTGILSIALAIQMLRLVALSFSVFKVSKTGIQGIKAFKIGEQIVKPFTKKFIPLLSSSLIIYFDKIFKGGQTKLAEKKENKFLTFLKNNKKTLTGLIFDFSAMVGASYLTVMAFLENTGLPIYACILIAVAIYVFVGVILGLAICGRGLENSQKVQLAKFLNKLGVPIDDLLAKAEEINAENEKLKAVEDANAKVEADNEAKIKAVEELRVKQQEAKAKAEALAQYEQLKSQGLI